MRIVSVLGAPLIFLSACNRPEPPLPLFAVLPNAPELQEGARVTYRGILIGTVDRISFSDTAVLVALHVTRPDAPIRIRDQVRIASLGLLGDKVLAIIPGPPDAPRVAAADTLSPAPPDSLAEAHAAKADSVMASALRRFGASPAARDSTGARRGVATSPSP
jgi:ABC-type transporter Mla subunit MlaD